MSGFISFGGSATATNPNATWQRLGLQSNGSGVLVTAGNGVKGSYTAIGTASAALCGIELWFGEIGSGTQRVLIDVFTDGVGTTVRVPNVAFSPGSGRWFSAWLPVTVSNGAEVGVKMQGSSGITGQVYVRGLVAASDLPPGFDNAEAIVAADTTNTRAASNSIEFTTSATTFTEIEDSTAREYGAILFQVSAPVAPTNSLPGNVALATGAAASEVIIGDFPVRFTTATQPLIAPARATVLKTVASGTRLSGRLLTSNAGAPDTMSMGAIGFY